MIPYQQRQRDARRSAHFSQISSDTSVGWLFSHRGACPASTDLLTCTIVLESLLIERGPCPFSNYHLRSREWSRYICNIYLSFVTSCFDWDVPARPWTFAESITKTERLSGWLPWSSLMTLKLAFNVTSDDQDNDLTTILFQWLCWNFEDF